MIIVSIQFIGDRVTGLLLKENDVGDLGAATNIEVSPGTANNLDIGDLVRSNAIELCLGIVVFACCALAVDKNLRTTATATQTTTAAAGITATTAATGHIHARDSIHHIRSRNGCVLSEIVGLVNDGRVVSHVVLGVGCAGK